MKRFLIGCLAFVLVVAATGYAFRTTLMLRLMENVVASRFQTDLLQELPDGLHVVPAGGVERPSPTARGRSRAGEGLSARGMVSSREGNPVRWFA